jgi:hypothetical protein
MDFAMTEVGFYFFFSSSFFLLPFNLYCPCGFPAVMMAKLGSLQMAFIFSA